MAQKSLLLSLVHWLRSSAPLIFFRMAGVTARRLGFASSVFFMPWRTFLTQGDKDTMGPPASC